jgi:oxygen-independent coproporphyrinogen III oxidase
MIENLNLKKKFINSKQVKNEFINLFNKPGPYYSSYPILSEWKTNDSLNLDYQKNLTEFFEKNISKPVTLYVHIPYCAKLCYYCSCRMHISNNRKVINQFVQDLLLEIELLHQSFKTKGIKPNIKEIHLGGGTPSHLTVDEITEIMKSLERFIDLKALDEFSMEIDPRTVSNDDFKEYKNLGVDRISFGVQDFDPVVQKKINREQPFELIEKLMNDQLRKYFKGVNFDLLFGLPAQTIQTFQKTIELTKKLSPERITLIKYAHIPQKRKHLKMIYEEDLPPSKDLPLMFLNSTESLIEHGYSWVGIDHFAKKDDALAIAKTKGEVYRNFGGETPGYTKDMISVGPTSTSGFGNFYYQSTYDLGEYRNYVRNGKFPINKKYHLSNDDLIRRDCNFALQCNQKLKFEEINNKYKINFETYFKKELEVLKTLENQNFIKINSKEINVTVLGRYFVRHLCQVFDNIISESKKYQIHGN